MCNCGRSRLVWADVTFQPADEWRARLRTALFTARKDRETARVSALRSALSAIDNAETPDGVQLAAPSSGKIAGGVVGVGAAEVERRQLSDTQIRELLRAEIEERLSAAEEFNAGGHAERAATLLTEAAELNSLLGHV
jgi:uncharacterized protein